MLTQPGDILCASPNETPEKYWQRENKRKELDDIGREKELKLYCQSCCYRYPNKCMDVELLHPYDRAAETCPDFVPKDIYKPKSKSTCLLKRLSVDPLFTMLPNTEIIHPIYPEAICDAGSYYKIMTKRKVYNQMEAMFHD